MKAKKTIAIAGILIAALVAAVVAGPAPSAGYLALVPQTLQAGAEGVVSLTLFNGEGMTSGTVEVSLIKDGEELLRVEEEVYGKGRVEFEVPDVEEGEYEIKVKGEDFEDSAKVTVERGFLTFIESDKPIYKPGQSIKMRVITLDPGLMPINGSVTVEILDAKGIKVFRSQVETDGYGMATLELPLSHEPNLGVWTITAVSDKGEAQLDVRVEEYVLPKYEVEVELTKEWFLVDEIIAGTVAVEYSFGKPVSGELVINASRYVGIWEEYASFSGAIDGEAQFQIPAAMYVAGVPAAGGLGNVMLNISVIEDATGYEECSSELLIVSPSSLNIQLIPEGPIFKPGLPFNFLVVTETPSSMPVDSMVSATVSYFNQDFDVVATEDMSVATVSGKGLMTLTPPEGVIALLVEASANGAYATRALEAGYSPSGNFIHLEQISEGTPQIGEEIRFKVHSTSEATNFYYEVVSRDRVVFSDYTRIDEISMVTTPQMSPGSKLLVYQILPTSEVAVDYLPFQVTADYLHDVTVEFSAEEARPGERVTIYIDAEGQSKVGLTAVDKSVFILAEGRLNMEQVFAELERLYMQPQVELHQVSIYSGIDTRGSNDIFEEAGMVVLSNKDVPQGKEYKEEIDEGGWGWFGGGDLGIAFENDGMKRDSAAGPSPTAGELAAVERVRQYFPETWLWTEVVTDANGSASLEAEVPDSITTWMLRAVALSKEKGLGVTEAQLTAFQPFFLKLDLPYSAIRGEEFPIKVAVYNYLDSPQTVTVELKQDGWFDLLDGAQKQVVIEANDIGGVEFNIRPRELGTNEVQVSARSAQAADAMVKTLIVEPEGVSREVVENLTLYNGSAQVVDTSIPASVVEGSGRVYLTATASYMTQTIEGLEGLLQMPFGCGEQNMLMFAPDVYVTKYLEESGQLKPEIMAKAEMLMITGYQRELTYRRGDGSFSAFGESDDEGSLFLTAFVLKCFSQAQGLIYIDGGVLSQSSAWITAHQNPDGSFDPVGFVCHRELMGGVEGKVPLTAYVAIALLEAGERSAADKAIGYLEGELGGIDDGYTAAIVAYALELAGSARTNDAYDILVANAEADENGLHWGQGDDVLPQEQMWYPKSTDIEATAYAAMALVEHGDVLNAPRAVEWLVSNRNAYGGFGSTQDTVVALQALTEYSAGARADVALTLTIKSREGTRELTISQSNFDILQVVELPADDDVEISVTGRGEAIAQVVERFNLPQAEAGEDILKVSVDYNANQVEVNDIVEVAVGLEFNPPMPMEAGMVVLDISIPTGFAAVTESIDSVIDGEAKIKRYETAGRKVIFYIENMQAGESLSFSFDVQAMYPVKAKGVSSEAYSYYNPEIKGETLSQDIVVSET